MTLTEQAQGPYVIFDGTCGLCNRFVVFALRRDRSQTLRFVSNHSSVAQQLLASVNLVGADAQTVVVVEGSEALVRSSAMIFVASRLGWPWSILAVFRFVPRFLRDWGYSLVARNRIAIFGRVGECALVPAELRQRIIE